ncbi:MAG TPA: hypothetical protein VLL54_21630 [Pyrinomonadaceae bacterium]|nr:hypothetical protein [Pyrinomonadaceae bacterium]
MKTKMLSLGPATILVAAIMLGSIPAASVKAQSSLHDWSTVQAVAADERLVVEKKDGKTITGKMIEATATNLTISRRGKVENIPRENIQQIYHSTGKAEKAKWAGIGAGIGTAAGGGIGAAKAASVSDDGGIYVLAGLLIGAGAGAVSGLAFGESRRHRELIYTTP